ncbi:MAG: tetratricopeptide repeat protein, partial [Chloroflexi bacterium]|nr:tetratricopeptide repeat protein [Chloroflexota bacterium]
EEYCYTLGFSYAYLGRCEEALPWFEKALELNSSSQVAQQGLEYCGAR